MQQTKDSKEKVRVFALARTLGVDSKTLIDLSRNLGFDVKSQLASLEPEQVEALKQRLARGAKPATPEPAKATAAPIPPKDKKIVNLIGKPKPEPRVEPEHAPQLAEPVESDSVETHVDSILQMEPVAEEYREVEAINVPVANEPETDSPQTYVPAEEVASADAETEQPATMAVQAEVPIQETAADVAIAIPNATLTPKLPTVGTGRMMNLSSSGGRTAPTTRPPGVTPMKPASSTPVSAPLKTRVGTPPPPARPVTIPPRGPASHGGAAQRPGSAPPAGGGAGPRDPSQRHRRSEADRKPGQMGPAGPRPPLGGDKDKKPVAAGPLKFTAEQLQALREGRSVTDVLKKTPPPAPGAVVGQAPAQFGPDGEELDEDGKKKVGGPGKVVGRDVRHADRAKRQEQRKVRQKDVVIQGNQVEVIEDEHGSKRGRRAAMQKKLKRQPGTVERKGKVPITLPITVRSLSEAIGMKVFELVIKLKDLTNSTQAININSAIEQDVAELIATEKGVEFEIIQQKSAERDVYDIHKEALDDESKLEPRAPVVTIMGHVDHGKTSLLDKIRQSNIVATEAGGITQVIRAWRVVHNSKPITFLDTPGHEAFTKMRARGANVTDIVVIVVAANDGVMPQTEEAIAHAKAAGVSMVVAINKIDMPDANIKRTEQQLYSLGLIPDTMGGDCQFVQTSATKSIGIGELLDTLSLVAEVKELNANPHKPAMGTCLEAHLSGDEGVRATMLVQQGTLHPGDVIICGASYGRVRAMYDDLGNSVSEAGPSVPVVVTGLDEVPNADDHFHVVMELAKAREISTKRKAKAQESQFKPREVINVENLGAAKIKISELKVVLKAEARGSVEAIRKELEKLVHEEVRVRLLHAGIGAITESDVQLALASPDDTIVVGFNVVPDDKAMHLAETRGISIQEYNIIYKLTDDIRAALEGKLKPREEVIHLGRALIREVYKISKVGTVAGSYVTQGTIERSAKIRVIREGAVIFPPADRVASLDSLKRFKEDVREVREGFECGIKLANYDDVKVGDVIEAYRIELVQRTLLDR